jgi:hypothetical protein
MKNILVGNVTRKRLLKLRKELNLRNDNQVILYLLDFKERRDFDQRLLEIFNL